jgi:hypothetical protein
MRITAFLRHLSTVCVLTLLAATAATAAPLDFKDVLVSISTEDFLELKKLEVVAHRPRFDACVDLGIPFCFNEVWQESWTVCIKPWGQERLVAMQCGARKTVTRRCVDRMWQEETSYADDLRYCIEDPSYTCKSEGIVQSQEVRVSSQVCP